MQITHNSKTNGSTTNRKRHLKMNSFLTNNNLTNQRMELSLSPHQRKLQKSSRDADVKASAKEKVRTPVRRSKSNVNAKKDARGRHRKVASTRTTSDDVLELLELLQSTSNAMMKSNFEVNSNKDRRQPPQRAYSEGRKQPPIRTYSEELFTPSRRHNRTGLRTPLRMMPKLKSASMADLYDEKGNGNGNGTSTKKGGGRSKLIKNTKKDELTKYIKQDDIDIDIDIDVESSPTRNLHPSDESIDQNSFLQESPSALGDFHPDRRGQRYRRKSKSQDETQPKSPSSDGLVLHSTKHSTKSPEANWELDNQAGRRRKQCSAGGKVRNHRTREEYTGFFLTTSTEDNIKHGYGITKFPDGRLFEGVYEKGTMVEGKMTYPRQRPGTSCATYIGKFDEDGLRCGKGIYTTATTSFLGQFRRDQQHGSGILIYNDGNDDADTSQSRRFIGHWKDGKKHGYGREILADGTIAADGLWEDGHFAGAADLPR